MVLWGKEGDKEVQIDSQEPSNLSYEEQKETKIQVISSMEMEVNYEVKPKS